MSTFKKAWLLLNHKQKKYAILIFVMMFIAMILEVLSIGIILPLLSILLKGDIDSSFFNYFFIFGVPTKMNLIYMGLLVTVIVFSIKNLFLIFNLWQQSKFVAEMNVTFSDKLFKNYLKRDYIFFLQTNTAQLYRNVSTEVVSFVDYISKMMLLLNEIVIFTGIVFILFYVDKFGTIVILTLISIFAFIIYKFTRKKVDLLGKERIIYKGDFNKYLLQGLFSVKEVKILDREEDFIQQIYKTLIKLCENNLFINFITGLPRYGFEILMVVTFSILVLTMLNTNRDMISIIQYLGVFGVASLRLVPGAAKLISSYQGIKYRKPSVILLSKELDPKNNSYVKKNSRSKELNAPIEFKREISLTNLCFSYPERKEFSLSKISMTIKKGDFIGIIGETGSGKSTLINLLIGLLKPSEGKVKVDESNINSNLPEWYKKIGYIPQSVYLIDDTIRKNIAFGLRDNDIDEALIKQAVEQASLDKFLKNLPNGLDTIVGENGIRISGGQQQRIGIARALYRDPEILILDEATSSLDRSTEKKIMDSVQFLKRKKTLIIITHRLTTVECCDMIFFIDKGKITKRGSPKEILNSI